MGWYTVVRARGCVGREREREGRGNVFVCLFILGVWGVCVAHVLMGLLYTYPKRYAGAGGAEGSGFLNAQEVVIAAKLQVCMAHTVF